jgi:hypothetical protein
MVFITECETITLTSNRSLVDQTSRSLLVFSNLFALLPAFYCVLLIFYTRRFHLLVEVALLFTMCTISSFYHDCFPIPAVRCMRVQVCSTERENLLWILDHSFSVFLVQVALV